MAAVKLPSRPRAPTRRLCAETADPVRVAWITPSPTHYHAPLYRLVAADPRVDLTVVYLSRDGLDPYDGGYQQQVTWDLDLLSGYRSQFVRRASRNRIGQGPLSYRDVDIAGAVLRGRYDVLILQSYSSLAHQSAALAQLLRGRPVIFKEAQTLLAPRPAWKTALKRLWLPLVFGRSHALCAGTENDRWFAQFGVPKARRFLSPNAVDNERLHVEVSSHNGSREALRRKFGLPSGGYPVILAVGRMIPQKDPLTLLRAYARVRATTPCALLYVGSGPLLRQIEAEARERRTPDVHLAGFVEQSRIAEAYVASDLLVLPSLDEPWGMVVNEAMACGLPVVASDRVGAGTDLVHDGANGYVVRAGDVAQLADALQALVSSKARRDEFGRVSRQVIERWNHECAAAATLMAIASAVGPLRWMSASLDDHLRHAAPGRIDGRWRME